jgi:uncharacterized protein with GYD domain
VTAATTSHVLLIRLPPNTSRELDAGRTRDAALAVRAAAEYGRRVDREEKAMATYVVLFNWTEQGVRGFKESPARVQSSTAQLDRLGVRITDIYWTLGPYDLVALVEADDDESLTAALLELAAVGNVRTTTLRAFGREEFGRIVGKTG